MNLSCDFDTDLIAGYIDGDLVPQERAGVVRHLLRCEPCRGAMVKWLEEAFNKGWKAFVDSRSGRNLPTHLNRLMMEFWWRQKIPLPSRQQMEEHFRNCLSCERFRKKTGHRGW